MYTSESVLLDKLFNLKDFTLNFFLTTNVFLNYKNSRQKHEISKYHGCSVTLILNKRTTVELQSVTKHFGQRIKIASGCNMTYPSHPPFNVGWVFYPAKVPKKSAFYTSNIVQGGGREGSGLYTLQCYTLCFYLYVLLVSNTFLSLIVAN